MTGEIDTAAEAMEAAAMTRAGIARCDRSGPEPAELQPLPEAVARKPVGEKSPAEWAYERIVLYIRNFEESLNPEEEAALGFAGSNTGLIRIAGIGFFAPDLVTFYGTDGQGHRTQLIQHVSQLNVALRAVPKARPDEPAQRIGFRLAEDLGRED
ncbi:hypothetical protein HKCCE3408_09965 [Rhodobacterales bacterium HKCCE3408]|nr:hypothetical protein [Rhodobacterales bacterium HKCCE3408]